MKLKSFLMAGIAALLVAGPAAAEQVAAAMRSAGFNARACRTIG